MHACREATTHPIGQLCAALLPSHMQPHMKFTACNGWSKQWQPIQDKNTGWVSAQFLCQWTRAAMIGRGGGGGGTQIHLPRALKFPSLHGITKRIVSVYSLVPCQTAIAYTINTLLRNHLKLTAHNHMWLHKNVYSLVPCQTAIAYTINILLHNYLKLNAHNHMWLHKNVYSLVPRQTAIAYTINTLLHNHLKLNAHNHMWLHKNAHCYMTVYVGVLPQELIASHHVVVRAGTCYSHL